MPVLPYKDTDPTIADSVWIAPNSWITGDVTAAENSSFFFGSVARGDILPIRVGSGSNIQDHAMLHTSHGLGPCIVGNRVTVGHRAIIHGAEVKDSCIIGMGAVVLDGAVVGSHSIVGAQALVPMNMQIPERSLVVGVPAKVVRELSAEEVEQIEQSADSYIRVSQQYMKQLQG